MRPASAPVLAGTLADDSSARSPVAVTAAGARDLPTRSACGMQGPTHAGAGSLKPASGAGGVTSLTVPAGTVTGAGHPTTSAAPSGAPVNGPVPPLRGGTGFFRRSWGGVIGSVPSGMVDGTQMLGDDAPGLSDTGCIDATVRRSSWRSVRHGAGPSESRRPPLGADAYSL